ncbi:MAG: hypothetical protein IKD80_01495 [Selenomonadaceae bacterium]|nr:hypothetical protein [Selenomonadaceae bacterium]
MLSGFTKVQILQGSSFMLITNNGINFNGNVVFHMQKTKYVIFLLNTTDQQIAIQKCDDEEDGKILFFRDGTNWRNGVRINNRELQQMIARMMSRDLDKYNYRADGVYSDDDHAMIFNLKNARSFNKRRKQQSSG